MRGVPFREAAHLAVKRVSLRPAFIERRGVDFGAHLARFKWQDDVLFQQLDDALPIKLVHQYDVLNHAVYLQALPLYLTVGDVVLLALDKLAQL